MSATRRDGDEDNLPRFVAKLRESMEWIRNDSSRRRWVTSVSVLVGLALATLHPIGLLVGGALSALPQRRLGTGLLGGLGFGLVTLVAFGAALAVQGALATAVQTGEIFAVTVSSALLLPVLGSLTRGLV